MLIGLGFIGYASGLPTTFVSYGLDVEEQVVLDGRSIKEQIFNDIIWKHHVAVQRGRIGRTGVPPPKFKTADEYREKVGEEQFAIEMDEGVLSRPHSQFD